MNDLYVMGVVCSLNKVDKRSLSKVEMKCGNVEMTSDKLKTTRGKLGVTSGKTLRSYVFYLVFIKILFCVCLAHARQQGLGTPVATGVALSTDSIKPLQIGDSIPSALWNLPLQMLRAGQEGGTTVRLNDYKGKLIILDFWATWCSPCVAAFPKMDSLRAAFKNELAIIPVTTQDKTTVSSFLSNMHESTQYSGFSIINDDILKAYFKHKFIPHYVWITPEGIFEAATNGDQVSKDHITSLMAGKATNLKNKQDIKKSSARPVTESAVFYSYLAGYQQGNASAVSLRVDEQGGLKLKATNLSCLRLFQIAYSEMKPELMRWNRTVLEVEDERRFRYTTDTLDNDEWMERYALSYEIRIPNKDTVALFKRMREDLAWHFPYKAALEIRLVDCIILKLAKGEAAPTTAGGEPKMVSNAFAFQLQNMPWSWFPMKLASYYFQHLPKPLVDDTQIVGKVDLAIQAKMALPQEVKKSLSHYGILLVEEKKPLQLLIIKDK